MYKGEIITCFIIFFGSIYLYFETFKFKGHEVYGKLGPAIWPRFLLIVLMALSFLVAIDIFRRERKKFEREKKRIEDSILKFFVALVIIGLYFFNLVIFGFIIITPIFLIAFMYILGERKKIWMIGVSLGITFLIVYVFTKVMYVPLPRGTGIFLNISKFFY